MPKFAKASTQAHNVIKALTKTERIQSLGTARNYEDALKRVSFWVKEKKLNGLQSLSLEQARFYLEYRAESVGQKTLDMERQALQAMMQLNGRLPDNGKLYIVKSELAEATRSRAYTRKQAEAVSQGQSSKHSLATQIAYAAGLRAHELLTLARNDEREPDRRKALSSKWDGRSGSLYTVVGKGGLKRHVLIPTALVNQLEQRRLKSPVTVTDRQIKYLQRYDIGGGKKMVRFLQ